MHVTQDLHRVVHRCIEAFMDLFGTVKTIRRLKGRLEAHEERIDDLARDMRNLKIDMLETYDKTHRLFGRIAKRAALDNPADHPPLKTIEAEPGALDEISAKIHARRAAGKP